MLDYADWSKDGPSLSSRAKMEEDGMINIWVDLKRSLPDLPKDYARPVKEWATDPIGAKDCPPLCIVIFIVGSRGESRHRNPTRGIDAVLRPLAHA